MTRVDRISSCLVSLARTSVRASSAAALALALLAAIACGGPRDCTNGTCECPEGGACDFTCEAPPCHVDCTGDNPSCKGTCGNATCTCGPGSSCEFECDSGPCHVDCQGDNASCSGTCANGTCYCGEASSCEFSCLDDNCKFDCDGDCLVRCEEGERGQSCGINSCKSGGVETCADGIHLACGASCPAPVSNP